MGTSKGMLGFTFRFFIFFILVHFLNPQQTNFPVKGPPLIMSILQGPFQARLAKTHTRVSTWAPPNPFIIIFLLKGTEGRGIEIPYAMWTKFTCKDYSPRKIHTANLRATT